jgi:histidine triad (HIT) family protein
MACFYLYSDNGKTGQSMEKSTDCIFCKIVRREIPAKIVFENEHILAFRDVSPQAPVHILIIPKKHIPGLNDISAEEEKLLGEIQLVAKELAAKEKVSVQGYRLVVNCGPDAGQAVAHLHYHLVGGRKFTWPPG